jgi:mannuronan synthase
MAVLINFIVCAAVGLFGWFSFLGLHLGHWGSTGNVLEFVTLGLIGIWRWSQFSIRLLRAWYYQLWRFPQWRKVADRLPSTDLPPVCLIVPTYQEKPWITERVFQAIVREAYSLDQPLMVFVSSASAAENQLIQTIVTTHDPENRVRLILRTQSQGKRKALADSLRELREMGVSSDTVIALMDGDSELSPGVLRKSLPFFRLFPKMGGLTTHEMPIVQGSFVFSEWFHLRFVQRHYQMCSDGLSRKVMCLTGRFSLFRGEAALHPGFADQLEFDQLDDWLWGKFRFLSGDDKSTWFWLLKHRYEMLYIPDAMVYSIETVTGPVMDRAIANMQRWFGNMLRNNRRALALGPRVTGWGIWYALLDQRLNIWTSLIAPVVLLISLILGDWLTAGLIVAWTLMTRPLMLMLIFCGQRAQLKPIHIGLLVMMQWLAPLIKIKIQMNLAQQKWTNRGQQSIDIGGSAITRRIKRSTAQFMILAQMIAFIMGILIMMGLLKPWADLATWQFFQQVAQT